jgi:hypothetical protein
VTTSQGTYELPGLPPGIYSVQFFKAGFAAFTAKDVEQLVGQTRTLNARLEVARGKEQTTVTEPLVQLDKVDATIGHRDRTRPGRRFADQRQELGDADRARAGRHR